MQNVLSLYAKHSRPVWLQMSSDGTPQNIAGGTRDCDGLDEKAHQGSKVEKVGEPTDRGDCFQKMHDQFASCWGVQKGGNISAPVCPT